MTRLIHIPLVVIFISAITLLLSCNREKPTPEPATYVNPFIGTDAHGHTFPGASVPFGMVQLSPQTRLTGWDGCSGYHFSDTTIYGFAHTALNGTGVSDYGDILLMPVSGNPIFTNDEYCSSFSKTEESAQAGYYRVFLKKPGVLAELTASPRVGYHRYTFTESDAPGLIIDLQHRDQVLESWIEIVNNREIRGMRRSTNWAKDLVWYFHMEFSDPFQEYLLALENQPVANTNKLRGTNVKAFLKFNNTEKKRIEIKVGLSAVDVEGARQNLAAEIPHWNFEQVCSNAFNEWNQKLSKILVKGGSNEQKTAFYSAMYRAYLQPNIFQDVDGRYRGIDKKIHNVTNHTHHTVFSLWDTYRAWHPLMTILEPTQTVDFIKTMLDIYEKGGLLPIWELAANETWCMIGNHAISVIADAYMKGIQNFDTEKALQAMIHSATQDHFGLKVYREYGYIPANKEHESISKTLEYAYNDWCIAQMAKAMEKDEIYNQYIKRAQFYKNIFDPETGFMRPKINGGWLTPFDPSRVDWNFTEANSWQYSFYVPQDIDGLIALMGGKERFINQLDALFTADSKVSGRDMKDITGLIGQYAHGNEPSQHLAYLYNFAGQPWKTQNLVRKIMDEFYPPIPTGCIGNEDCGQMSAWLIFSAMGFYPVTPGKAEYILGSPWFPEMEIRLENGKTFRITAKNVSVKNRFIQSAKLNGTNYTKSYLMHSDIIHGGHLEFRMSDKPNFTWGSSLIDIPTTKIEDQLILPVPVITAADNKFKDSLKISISTIIPECQIFYTLDGSTPTKESAKYRAPIVLTKTTKVNAVAYAESHGYSHITEANFVKIDLTKKIQLISQYHPSYHAGGAEVLIDGIRGTENWRLGRWQGYQGTDFQAIIDLGSIRRLTKLSAGFIQDIRSWIWMPQNVSFYSSADGKMFTKIASIKNNIPADNYEVVIHDFKARVNTTTRYIKIIASNFGTIPEWHPGAGGQAFIFVDEIEVY